MPCICLPKLTIDFSTLHLISYNGYNTLVLLSHWGKNWGTHGCFCLFCYRHIRKGVTANGSGYPSLSLRLSIIQMSLWKKVDSGQYLAAIQYNYVIY